jgi:hypothetical protein
MTRGVNTAKQIVIDEANGYADKLKNGGAEDMETIGRAVGLLTKMVVSIYQCDFVTVEECKKMHLKSKGRHTRIKIGPLEFEGKVSAAVITSMIPLICCGILGFALGKANGWW